MNRPTELELLEQLLEGRNGPSDNEMILLALVGVLAARVGNGEPVTVSIDEMDAPMTRRVEIDHSEGDAPWVISFRPTAVKGEDDNAEL